MIGSNGVVGYHASSAAAGPGVLVTRSGSLRRVNWIGADFWPLNTMLWVKDFHGNVPRFIYYLLLRFDFDQYTTGVSVPTLNRNYVHPVRVGVPEEEEQKIISDILDAVERRIEAEEQSRDALTHLFDALVRDLMSGQLRVPQNESAVTAS